MYIFKKNFFFWRKLSIELSLINMSLRDKIEEDYKNSLKLKDKDKISTSRLILSAIKDLDIINRSGPNKKDTNDEDIKKLLTLF